MKKCLLPLLVFLFFAVALWAEENPKGGPFWTEARDLIVKELEEMGKSEMDLLAKEEVVFENYGEIFRKKDPGRFPIINDLMEKPLTMPDYTDAFGTMLKENRDSLRGTLVATLEKTGRPIPEVRFTFPYTEKFPLLKVVAEIGDRRGVSLSDSTKAVVERLDPPLNQGIALVLSGIDHALQRRDEAFSQLSKEDLSFILQWAPQYGPPRVKANEEGNLDACSHLYQLYSAKMKMEKVEEGALLLTDAIDQAVSILARYAQSEDAAQVETLRFDTPLGTVIIGSKKEDIEVSFGEDPVLLIDLGGDDIYSFQMSDSLRKIEHFVQVGIDLGGNDNYYSTQSFRQGAGYLGIGLLYDLEGDDDYRSLNHSQGCGLFGIGILADQSGDDRYYMESMGQGAAAFGVGILLDNGGRDEYFGGCFVQGFGSTGGIGVLSENGGDDIYIAGRKYPDSFRYKATSESYAQGAGCGLRFIDIKLYHASGGRTKIIRQFPGGIGMLADSRGNDRYLGDVFAQGSAYWYSLGLLVDGEGDDFYRACWYGQGSCAHSALSILLDKAGNDKYKCVRQSQGQGHDFSVGMLIDEAGDDRYTANQMVQGAGNHRSGGLGILADYSGNDVYTAQISSRGYSRHTPFLNTSGFPQTKSFGFFLDLGGQDLYQGADVKGKKNNVRWIQSEQGIGIDRER